MRYIYIYYIYTFLHVYFNLFKYIQVSKHILTIYIYIYLSVYLQYSLVLCTCTCCVCVCACVCVFLLSDTHKILENYINMFFKMTCCTVHLLPLPIAVLGQWHICTTARRRESHTSNQVELMVSTASLLEFQLGAWHLHVKSLQECCHGWFTGEYRRIGWAHVRTTDPILQGIFKILLVQMSQSFFGGIS